jgi:hypothetical protein
MLTILIIAAVVCFFLAAFGVASSSKVNLVALGLALWALAVSIEKLVM